MSSHVFPCVVGGTVVDVVVVVGVVVGNGVVVVGGTVVVVVGGCVTHGPGYSGTLPSSHQSIHGTGPESSGQTSAYSIGHEGIN